MKITQEFLKSKNACKDGLKYVEQWEGKEDIYVLNKLIEGDKLKWANWLIVRVMGYGLYVSYAIYAAEQVLNIFEEKYPDDKRPRNAIEAAKICLENPAGEAHDVAAYDADIAANVAAHSAATYVAAVYDKSSDAAYAAAYAARSAAAHSTVAAEDAGTAAVYVAATVMDDSDDIEGKLMITKILQYGIELLEDL